MRKTTLLLVALIAANAAVAEIYTNVRIDGLIYSLDTKKMTASITGYDEAKPPSSLTVDKIVRDSKDYIVTSVGQFAFSSCQTLTSVSLPEVNWVAECAFECCNALQAVEIPKLSSVGGSAFDNCSALPSIEIPEATTIAGYAFRGCESLKSISLPNAATIIHNAFDGCSALTSIEIPKATFLDEKVFVNCDSLNVICVNASMREAISEDREKYGIADNVTLTSLTKEQTANSSWETTLKCGEEVINADEYNKACAGYGITPQPLPRALTADEVVVNKTSIRAAEAETVKVVNGIVTLGVNVCSNANFQAETKDWGKVNLTCDNVKVENGKIVITLPFDGDSGFMILQSGDAKIEAAE